MSPLSDPALGKYFRLSEFTTSQAAARQGLRNVPGPKALASLEALVKNVLDPLRKKVGTPIVVSSGYRSPAVNRAVGGSTTSQHALGEAADIIVPGIHPAILVGIIRGMNLPVDQVIEEFGRWVHVSYGPRNRRQYLKARTVGGKTQYSPL